MMTSFNELDAVPATASYYLLTDLFKYQLNFQGFVVTDYTAIPELVSQRVAENDSVAGILSIKAGVVIDMEGSVYLKYLKQQVISGAVSEELVNQPCRRVLRVKFLLGLFDNPYLYCNEEREKKLIYIKEHLATTYDMAKRSFVLLKNAKNVFPLKKGEKLAVIGELATSKRDLLVSWKAAGDWEFINNISGTMGAKAITDVLFGKYNPSGKLPMTYPRNIGQVPLFYYERNTGPPIDPQHPEIKYNSRYIDFPNTRLYPFGWGLSYKTFRYSDF